MSVCESCEITSLGCLGKATRCAKCSKLLCSTCAGNNALIPFDQGNAEFSNDLTKNDTIESYCKECYHEVSLLDYSKAYDDFGGATDQLSNNTITFLMVHGGGGSRAMFRPHAQALVKRGYRCILMDLPGHGTLVDSPLTLDSCVEATAKICKECGLAPETTVYVGVSLGAYIGFYILDKLPKNSFCGAILMDCGQNVGPDCSLKARAGIWFLKMAAGHMSNKALMGALMGVTKKSPAKYKVVESVFGAGMHFQQGSAQTICMHTVAPADHIPNYEFPVLFFNGTEDYRDSETRWLSLCKDKKRSALKVYEGGDHFFMNDESFVYDMHDRMDSFAKQVANTNA
jgi:pimeloyl-ACP methyl ester carboxylesterase